MNAVALREVRLYGHLAEEFGQVHHFAVRSPAEAVRALIANFPRFEHHVAALHHRPGYKVWCGGGGRGEKTLHDPGAGVIRIAPAIEGAGKKKKGFGQIILGAALIGASFFLPSTALFAAAKGALASVSLSSIALNFGVSMIIGGIGTLLSPSPKQVGTPERPDNKPSFAFDGPVNTTAQGNPVPVCYGRLRVGSQVISAGLSVEQIV